SLPFSRREQKSLLRPDLDDDVHWGQTRGTTEILSYISHGLLYPPQNHLVRATVMIRRLIKLTGARTQIEGLHWQSDVILRVGRLPHYEIVLKDPSISRQHAEIAATPDGWIVRDLNSTNGTSVNGRRVRGAQTLQPGDVLVCGNVAMRVE